jgi:hypothetical protein
MTWISKPRAFERQLIPAAKRMNPPKSKLFGSVAFPEIDVAELNYPLDQRNQVRCYFRFSPLVIDKWQK